MVEVLPPLPALVGHLSPDGSDDISLLPGVDVSCGLSHPVHQVLPF